MTGEERGRTVIANSTFKHGQFVCEYAGKLLERKTALKLEKEYPEEMGSYMFYFEHRGKKKW